MVAMRSRPFSRVPTPTIARARPRTAIAACDRFIRTYPNSTNVDYAYYLKGLVNFREDQGLFGYVIEQDLSERDPKMTRESFGAFKELVTRFPDSKYAADSVDRMRYLTNALGMYEVHVGRYYYNRGAYIAAVNRAAATVTNYPQTPANEQALILMVQGYDKLGMPQLRDDRAARARAELSGQHLSAHGQRPSRGGCSGSPTRRCSCSSTTRCRSRRKTPDRRHPAARTRPN